MLKNLLAHGAPRETSPRKKDEANFQGARLPTEAGSIEYLKSKVLTPRSAAPGPKKGD
jgi:hypothetical protein